METLLEGIISVRAAIEGGCREIKSVFVDVDKYKKRDRKITSFVAYLKGQGISPELCEREIIDGYVRESSVKSGLTHGGVVASVGERNYAHIEEILEKTAEDGGFCVYLDGIEDPFNLGFALRSLYAAGCSGLILPESERLGADSVIAKSSAGASERLLTARLSMSGNAERRSAFLRLVKSYGISPCCAGVRSDAVSVFDYEGFPMMLFIGGEKRGISPEFFESADKIISVPYANESVSYSLPASSVASVCTFTLANKIGKV